MKEKIQLSIATMFLTVSFAWGQDIINPVSATTTLNATFGSTLDNTINGEGLDEFPSLLATHGPTIPANAFYAINEAGSIDFDLGGAYNINGFSFWNVNAPGPGSTGIQGVLVSSSLDGLTYTPIEGAPTVFSQVTDLTTPAETFSFESLVAYYIRFDVISNYEDPWEMVAFAEVAFLGSSSDLGVTDNVLSEAIDIYPNPATASITITNNSDLDINEINVYDMNGRLVHQLEVTDNSTNQQLDISALDSGIYMVQISSGETTTFRKVIKE